MLNKFNVVVFSVILTTVAIQAKKSNDNGKPEWAKKDIRYYNDADMERLLDQWNVSPIIYNNISLYALEMWRLQQKVLFI